MRNIDETDAMILRQLQRDSSLTTKELAAAVNLSPSPTFERPKRLENEGYILKYVAVVNPLKVGDAIVALCNIRLKQHSRDYMEQFVATVMRLDEVVECYNTSGDYDFMMKLYVKSMHHYQDFVINKLGTMESVGSVHSVFVIDTVKNTHSIPVRID